MSFHQNLDPVIARQAKRAWKIIKRFEEGLPVTERQRSEMWQNGVTVSQTLGYGTPENFDELVRNLGFADEF